MGDRLRDLSDRERDRTRPVIVETPRRSNPLAPARQPRHLKEPELTRQHRVIEEPDPTCNYEITKRPEADRLRSVRARREGPLLEPNPCVREVRLRDLRSELIRD